MPASKKKAPVVAEGAELPPSVFAELERRVNQVNHHQRRRQQQHYHHQHHHQYTTLSLASQSRAAPYINVLTCDAFAVSIRRSKVAGGRRARGE